MPDPRAHPGDAERECRHPGCLSHRSHPCESCGKVGGKSAAVTEMREYIQNMQDAADGAGKT